MSSYDYARRSRAEISSRLERDGFPELVRHWKRFLRLGIEPERIEPSSLERSRNAHTAPLFGRMRLVFGLLFAVAVAAGYALTAYTDQGGSSVGTLPAWITATLIGASILCLMVYAIMTLQRYVAHPMENILAVEVAFALSVVQFGSWLTSTAAAEAVVARLERLGVSSAWDDPTYATSYVSTERGIERTVPLTVSQLTLETVRDLVGRKENRKHVPGRYFAALIDGKRSVTAICEKYKEEIQLCKEEALDPERAAEVLGGIEAFVAEEHPVRDYLRERIAFVRSKTILRPGEIRTEIWQRDPWVDLTHQAEFFSSASLRGVHPMGRSSKGRLGPFGYLFSKSVSALDFRNKQGRVVRARLGAAFNRETERAILFVDGVEGTNAISPSVIRVAIEDYARACGFGFVLYNAFAHNQVPKRFIRFVAQGGLDRRSVDLSYAEADSRLYLDAFGLPLEPFEYALPKGRVIGYLACLQGEIQAPGRAPLLREEAYQWARVNCLWILAGGSSCFAMIQLYSYVPLAVAPFVAVITLLACAHVWYQRKGLRSR